MCINTCLTDNRHIGTHSSSPCFLFLSCCIFSDLAEHIYHFITIMYLWVYAKWFELVMFVKKTRASVSSESVMSVWEGRLVQSVSYFYWTYYQREREDVLTSSAWTCVRFLKDSVIECYCYANSFINLYHLAFPLLVIITGVIAEF